MKNRMEKRIVSFLLIVMLLLNLLPMGALAVETGTFVLVAEANGELIIAPEYITYTSGQTIKEALFASGHTFTGLEDSWISAINGVVGNYTRSDENGGFDLDAPASSIKFFRFSENSNSQPSEGLQKLMSVMAAYQQKSADVQMAAKTEYDTAYAQFVGIDSESAALLADLLEAAINVYENALNGTHYRITFTDGSNNHQGATISAQNTYGKIWADDGDGVLELPAGDYTFCINRDGLWIEGNIAVSGDMTVTAAFPEELWLKLDSFRLSGSYGAENNEENRFSDDEYSIGEWDGRQTTVAVSDTFTGKIYAYAEYHADLLPEIPTLTAVYTSAETGEIVEQNIPFESLTSGAANVLKKGAAGNTVIYRISSKLADGYTYSQDYAVTFARVPSLASIQVSDQRGIDQAAGTVFDGNVTNYTYKVLDTVTAVTVKAQPLDENYSITVNGYDIADGVTVDVEAEGATTIEVVVSANDYSNTYTLTILPGEGKTLSFVTDSADVTIEVVNSNGVVLPYEKFREGATGNRYQYVLVPGETYSYVATAGTYYHMADEFTMEDVADSTIRVAVPKEDWLTELAFGTKSSGKYKGTLPMDTAFHTADHHYRISFIDTEHLAYIWASAGDDVTIQVIYDQNYASALYHGKENVLDIISGSVTGMQLKRFLMDENPIENTALIRLTKEIDGVTYYQDYLVDFARVLTLSGMTVQCDGITASLIQGDESIGFTPDVVEYTVTVSMAAKNLELFFSRHTSNTCYGEEEVGYQVLVDGVDVTAEDSAMIELDGTIETQRVVVTVVNDKAPEGSTEYTLYILKSPPVEVSFEITPDDAVLAIYDALSGERIWADENGFFNFCEGYSYVYALTKYGYVSRFGTLSVTRSEDNALVLQDAENSYIVEESGEGGGMAIISWTLEKATVNSAVNTGLTALWPNFRGSDTNNGVVNSAIPTAADQSIGAVLRGVSPQGLPREKPEERRYSR